MQAVPSRAASQGRFQQRPRPEPPPPGETPVSGQLQLVAPYVQAATASQAGRRACRSPSAAQGGTSDTSCTSIRDSRLRRSRRRRCRRCTSHPPRHTCSGCSGRSPGSWRRRCCFRCRCYFRFRRFHRCRCYFRCCHHFHCWRRCRCLRYSRYSPLLPLLPPLPPLPLASVLASALPPPALVAPPHPGAIKVRPPTDMETRERILSALMEGPPEVPVSMEKLAPCKSRFSSGPVTRARRGWPSDGPPHRPQQSCGAAHRIKPACSSGACTTRLVQETTMGQRRERTRFRPHSALAVVCACRSSSPQG